MSTRERPLDTAAAVTRSLLGWGVVAGPFYLVVGLVLAVTRPGFDLARHALSLLSLGELGWLQRGNLLLTGLMVLAAAWGFGRSIRSGRGLAIAVLVGVFGAGLALSAAFPPDPAAGFPPGAQQTASVSGILHLLSGALGFIALACAAFAYAAWARSERLRRQAPISTILGVTVLVGFVAGGALAQSIAGVLLLWLAVIAGFGWLALASARVYRWTPHPITGARG
jgi:hypothetical protein